MMKKMISKVKQKLNTSLNVTHHFGLSFGTREFVSSCLLRGSGTIGKKFEYYQYEMIKRWIKKKYFFDFPNMYEAQVSLNEHALIKEDCPIWIFWWQGLDSAPELVSRCINSIREQCQKHTVILLTKENVKDYADIPDFIYEKVDEGTITLTHYSDILRAQLLYQHGGIWMDSTIFMTDYFDEDIYKHSFYTIHHTKRADYHVCKGKWTGYFMASGAGNPMFGYLSKAFYKYWKNEKALICYLLIDCIIALGYENIADMKRQIDEVPINNVGTLEMATYYNNLYSEQLMSELCDNTYLHKLSNKFHAEKSTDTFYYYLLNDKKNATV